MKFLIVSQIRKYVDGHQGYAQNDNHYHYIYDHGYQFILLSWMSLNYITEKISVSAIILFETHTISTFLYSSNSLIFLKCSQNLKFLEAKSNTLHLHFETRKLKLVFYEELLKVII